MPDGPDSETVRVALLPRTVDGRRHWPESNRPLVGAMELAGTLRGGVPPPDPRGVRLAELVAALSLGIDLGFGQPMEHVLRQCLIVLRLAEEYGP